MDPPPPSLCCHWQVDAAYTPCLEIDSVDFTVLQGFTCPDNFFLWENVVFAVGRGMTSPDVVQAYYSALEGVESNRADVVAAMLQFVR